MELKLEFKCLVDGELFSTEEELNKHLRKLKIKIADYYLQYYDLEDLLTGEKIPFKDREQYLSTYFLNRKNMVDYFNANPSDLKTLEEMFEDRINKKGLKKALSQVELRTLLLPSTLLFNKIGVDYNEFNLHLKLNTVFNYDQTRKKKNINKDLVIFRDTREQMPLELDCKFVESKLDFGDYTASAEYFNDVFIERKSLTDLIGTLSGGHERFINEIERAKESNSYLIVAVEDTMKNFLHYRGLESCKKVKANPEFIAHRLREICQNYENVQFVFTENRENMVSFVEKIFKLENKIQKLDIQWAFDKGWFK